MSSFLKPIKLTLRSVQEESAEKVESSLSGPTSAREKFLELVRDTFSPEDVTKVLHALEYAESLPSRDPNHPSMNAYFAHPLRVATFATRLPNTPPVELTRMALLHNALEVSGLVVADIVAAGFEERMARGIKLLTIDRKRQYDPEYLEGFHKDISEFGADLMLIRCVDRLDNLLAFELIERTPTIATYIDLSEQFVVPMARDLADDFGDYLAEVIQHVRDSSCNQELKVRYNEFLKTG
jgi:(p)ppGpp synthase/HD superfamily hydrolase